MGCINSKQADSAASPALEDSSVGASKSKARARAAAASAAAVAADNGGGGRGGSLVLTKDPSGLSRAESRKEETCSDEHHRSRELKRPKKEGSNVKGSTATAFSFRLGFSHRFVDAEQVSAGWPTWLSAAAGEAIHGWVPLRADSFEKLEKVLPFMQKHLTHPHPPCQLPNTILSLSFY